MASSTAVSLNRHCRDRAADPQSAVMTTFGRSLEAIAQRARREAGEHRVEERADPEAGEHGDDGFGSGSG